MGDIYKKLPQDIKLYPGVTRGLPENKEWIGIVRCFVRNMHTETSNSARDRNREIKQQPNKKEEKI